jgi:hypothetical protein
MDLDPDGSGLFIVPNLNAKELAKEKLLKVHMRNVLLIAQITSRRF